MIMKVLFILVAILAAAKVADSATASGIVSYARRQIGSLKWIYSKKYVTPANTNKCNIFVADVLKHEDADAPNRWPIVYTPIGANEWGNKRSKYLRNARCWELCTGRKRGGDVIAEGGHVGIVTGTRKTTSAAWTATPHGKVVENNWGFRRGQRPTCWRYQYNKWLC